MTTSEPVAAVAVPSARSVRRGGKGLRCLATTRASNTATVRRSRWTAPRPPTTTPPIDPSTPTGIALARRELDATRLASLSRTEPLSQIHDRGKVGGPLRPDRRGGPARDPLFLWICECKDYTHAVPVDDVEEFKAKLDQIAGKNVKGLFATTAGLQRSALAYARAHGMGVLRFQRGRMQWVMRSAVVREAGAPVDVDDCITALTAEEYRDDGRTVSRSSTITRSRAADRSSSTSCASSEPPPHSRRDDHRIDVHSLVVRPIRGHPRRLRGSADCRENHLDGRDPHGFRRERFAMAGAGVPSGTDVAVDMGVSLAKGIGGEIGAAVVKKLFPEQAPDYMDEYFQKVTEYISREGYELLTNAEIDRLTGLINGAAREIQNKYMPRKESGDLSLEQLYNLLEEPDNKMYEFMGILEEERYVTAGFTIFMLGASLHLQINQEQALVNPQHQDDPDQSADAVTLKKNARNYHDRALSAFKKLFDGRKSYCWIEHERRMDQYGLSSRQYRWRDDYKGFKSEWSESPDWIELKMSEYIQLRLNAETDASLQHPKKTADRWVEIMDDPVPEPTKISISWKVVLDDSFDKPGEHKGTTEVYPSTEYVVVLETGRQGHSWKAGFRYAPRGLSAKLWSEGLYEDEGEQVADGSVVVSTATWKDHPGNQVGVRYTDPPKRTVNWSASLLEGFTSSGPLQGTLELNSTSEDSAPILVVTATRELTPGSTPLKWEGFVKRTSWGLKAICRGAGVPKGCLGEGVLVLPCSQERSVTLDTSNTMQAWFAEASPDPE